MWAKCSHFLWIDAPDERLTEARISGSDARCMDGSLPVCEPLPIRLAKTLRSGEFLLAVPLCLLRLGCILLPNEVS